MPRDMRQLSRAVRPEMAGFFMCLIQLNIAPGSQLPLRDVCPSEHDRRSATHRPGDESPERTSAAALARRAVRRR